MKVLCLIPARGGSKGLPGKNLRRVGGVTLVGRAVRAAREFAARLPGAGVQVVVDTDSEEIAREGRAWGAETPFLRPPELAADHTGTAESTLALLDRLRQAGAEYDAVILLQPTSPLRTAEDIRAVWDGFDPVDRPSAASVTQVDHPLEVALTVAEDGALAWWDAARGGAFRRQECRPAFRLTGAVYVVTPSLLAEHGAFTLPGVTRGVVLPAARSIDIDTAEDLALAEALAEARAGVASTRGLTDDIRIGAGAPCFVIAEAGVNHNGSVDLAHRLVDVAADSGSDAVKFQVFDPERLVSGAASKAKYQAAQTGEGTQLEMLRGLTLPDEAFRELAAHARDRGIRFLATPFDERSADFLEELGVSAFKIPSGEVTNHPFITHVARKGRPVLISTGMCSLPEVAAAVDAVRAAGDPPLALFHCVTDYPALPSDCNLSAMRTMRGAFGVPVGWSDHSAGLALSLAAVAMGAEIIEKHFTLDRTLPGPDHAASLEPDELAEMVAGIRAVEVARGDGIKVPTEREAANAVVVRRSLHTRRPLATGTVLQEEDLVSLRPATGVPPSELAGLVGRRLRHDVEAGHPVQWDDVE